ncbi:hypothetical protein [Actinophytocola sp.]|uniref:hypothetical protein n=1 Tax=Actinophytocola sp. TaxID=1872138 RepID=UPI002ED43D75
MGIIKAFRRIGVAGGTVALLLGTTVVPATAASPHGAHFYLSRSEVITQCGLTLQHDREVMISESVSQRRDGFDYFVDTLHGTDTLTNLANGKSFTQVFNAVFEKDMSLTDNGDGTVTLVGLAAGSTKAYGPDGARLFNDAGLVRWEVVFDDDEVLSFRVLDSTGRDELADPDDTENFCADLLSVIG